MSDYYAQAEAVLPLFRPPRVVGSPTSAAAADSLTPQTLNAMQRRVLEFLRAQPEGATDEEIANGLAMNPSTARPRRIELADRGMIVEAGTRPTSSRRKATVWRCA